MLLYMTERNLSRGSGIFLVNGNRELYSPLGNTAQNPPDGFARNLRADFPSYCPRQSAEKYDDASYAQALCGVAFIFQRIVASWIKCEKASSFTILCCNLGKTDV